ncbi:hypothetical protein [Paracoccus sp. JM45]|uniref:hypothetical protein n=1 Tax=Paracoccus sp. JM45 TaxID=2283626 RepID=UPI000E6C671F|nr:hypothetical protein [Paracoccus sp. JM45]RJE79960.1 hypothetical protein DWB67_09660 [Paracoccus sp. JM45]
MNPWVIAGFCLVGSGFIAWCTARLQLRWPLPVLALLLMAISLQLLFAARGQGGFHDLAAIVAQGFTTVPALLGAATGLALAHIRRHKIRWRSAFGLTSAVAFAVAAAASVATFLI